MKNRVIEKINKYVAMGALKNISDGDSVVKRLKNAEGPIPGLICFGAGTDTNKRLIWCGFQQLIYKK